jgi:uncharacterized protein with von Willebrand factor type A (vWA) domain
MERYGDFFPENPQNLDELLEVMAKRMAAMQAMLNSMTPEQRAQLQAAVRAAARGHGPALAGRAARGTCSRCSRRWAGTELRLRGSGPDMGFAAGAQPWRSWATSTSSSTCCGVRRTPARSPRPTSTGCATSSATTPPAASSACRAHQDAGGGRPHRAQGGPLELTPKGMRKIGQNALSDLFSKLAKDKLGTSRDRALGHRPRAHLRHQGLRVRRPVQPRHRAHDPQRDRAAPAVARRCGSPDDFEIERTEHLVRSSTVLMLDLSLSMPMRDNFLPAKKVAMALHSLISIAVPAGLPGHRRLQRGRPDPHRRAAARGVVGLRVRHEHAARLPAQPASCSPARAARSRSS